MNILKYECKSNLKVFLFWTLGLFILVFAGMTKFTGIEATPGAPDINKIFDQIPKVILAVFGMSGVNITSVEGYYSIIAFYAIICGAIYAIQLGNNAVSRELIDKTYEFIFTKPRSKKYILGMKVIAGWIPLLAISVLNLLFSVMSVSTLKIEGNINQLINLYSIVLFVLSSLFYALSIFIASLVKRAEKGSLYGNLCFLFVFVMSIVYDMLEDGKFIKILSPMKYFEANDLIAGKFDMGFLLLCLILTIVFIVAGFEKFKKNDFMQL